ncbi:Cytochrome c peroxidase [Dirofilaria immitis]
MYKSTEDKWTIEGINDDQSCIRPKFKWKSYENDAAFKSRCHISFLTTGRTANLHYHRMTDVFKNNLMPWNYFSYENF